MIECPNCKEISLPDAGGECEGCGVPTFFKRTSDVGFWHWIYHHSFGETA